MNVYRSSTTMQMDAKYKAVKQSRCMTRAPIPIRRISLQNYLLAEPQNAVSMQRKEISAMCRSSVLVAPLAA
jgi:hypothetical protein